MWKRALIFLLPEIDIPNETNSKKIHKPVHTIPMCNNDLFTQPRRLSMNIWERFDCLRSTKSTTQWQCLLLQGASLYWVVNISGMMITSKCCWRPLHWTKQTLVPMSRVSPTHAQRTRLPPHPAALWLTCRPNGEFFLPFSLLFLQKEYITVCSPPANAVHEILMFVKLSTTVQRGRISC